MIGLFSKSGAGHFQDTVGKLRSEASSDAERYLQVAYAASEDACSTHGEKTNSILSALKLAYVKLEVPRTWHAENGQALQAMTVRLAKVLDSSILQGCKLLRKNLLAVQNELAVV
jgi:hypothetical protein